MSHTKRQKELVILTNDEGHQREFFIIEGLSIQSTDYVLLIPADTEDEIEVVDGYIMKIESEENGEEYLSEIEDENEWKRAVDAYHALRDQYQDK